MYIKYAKDFYSGRILGVVVAIATNRVGWALAKPTGDITRETKNELIRVAISRAVLNTSAVNEGELVNYLVRNKDRNNSEFYDKVKIINEEYTDMCYKASKSATLPTFVEQL